MREQMGFGWIRTPEMVVSGASLRQLVRWHEDCVSLSGNQFDILCSVDSKPNEQTVLGIMPMHNPCGRTPVSALSKLTDHINELGGNAYLKPSMLMPGDVAITISLRGTAGTTLSTEDVSQAIKNIFPPQAGRPQPGSHIPAETRADQTSSTNAGEQGEREDDTAVSEFILEECLGISPSPLGTSWRNTLEPMMRITFTPPAKPAGHVKVFATLIAQECMLSLRQHFAMLEISNTGQVLEFLLDPPEFALVDELATADPIRTAIAHAKEAIRRSSSTDIATGYLSSDIIGACYITSADGRPPFAVSPGIARGNKQSADVGLLHYLNTVYSSEAPHGLVRAVVFYIKQEPAAEPLRWAPIDRALMQALRTKWGSADLKIIFTGGKGDKFAIAGGGDIFALPTRHWSTHLN